MIDHPPALRTLSPQTPPNGRRPVPGPDPAGRGLDETNPEPEGFDETKLKPYVRLCAKPAMGRHRAARSRMRPELLEGMGWSFATQWEFRQRIAGLAPDQKKSLTDYVRRSLDAGLPPFPATEAKLAAMEAHLLGNPGTRKSAHTRSLAARRALLHARAHDILSSSLPVSGDIRSKPRSQRSKRPPSGTFSRLAADIEAVCSAATNPRTVPCDPRRPVSKRTADRHAAQLERAADLAYQAGRAGRDISLRELLDVEIQRFWLEQMLGGTGNPRQHVRDGLVAYRFFAVRFLGADSA
ncbi:hypothetical protein [Brytella acorum]|uniref:hypothetical protein n=1 Tax=Brytella acorum TaxID=2959299 RepID=UPI0025AECA0E|nr:hypothetical protein [Brytella acorum]MDF3626228.1 hypothetical protein [Brytella acorum]